MKTAAERAPVWADIGLRADRPLLAERWSAQAAGATLHWHPHLEILWTERPALLHLADRAPLRLDEPAIYVLPPGTPHIVTTPHGRAERRVTGHDLAILEAALPPPPRARWRLARLKPAHQRLILPLLGYLETRLRTAALPTTDLRQAVAGLLGLLRDLGYTHPVRDRQPTSLLDQALESLYARHGDPGLEIADLARVTRLSPAQFRRAFRRHTGFAPRELLNRVRVHAARRLIAGGGIKRAVIARQVGFRSASGLYRRLRQSG